MRKIIDLDTFKQATSIFASCKEILGDQKTIDVLFVGTIGKKRIEADCVVWKTIDIINDVVMIMTKQSESFKTIKIKVGVIVKQRFHENYAMIEHVSRGGDSVAGTDVVFFVLLLLQKLGCERAILQDAATVACESSTLRLSLLQMMLKGAGWYEKFGFQIATDTIRSLGPATHHDDEKASEIAVKIFYSELEKIRSYPIKTFIDEVSHMRDALMEIYKSHKIHQLEFLDRNIFLVDKTIDVDSPDYHADLGWVFYRLLEHINELHGILVSVPTKEKATLAEFIAQVYSLDCMLYVGIIDHLINNDIFSWTSTFSDNPYSFRYNGTIYALPVVPHIMQMRNIAPYYIYKFKASTIKKAIEDMA